MSVLETHHFCSPLSRCSFTQRVRALCAQPIMRKMTPTFNYFKVIYFQVNLTPKGGGGGGDSLIWPIRVCAAEQGMVFRVLSLKQGILFHYLAS